MVRPRPLVTMLAALATIAAALATAPEAPAQDPASPSPPARTGGLTVRPPEAPALISTTPGDKVPLSKKPYKIRAWIAIDPEARLDDRGRDSLIADWQVLIRRFVGQPWQLEVAEGDGPLRASGLEALTPEAVGAESKGFDKAWVIQVGPIARGYGLTFSGREFDAATGELGLVGSRPAPSIDDAARALLLLSIDLFSPTAEIGKKEGGGVWIEVQGSALPAAHPVGRVVRIGSVFRPVRVHSNPDGSVHKIIPIPRTYMRVANLDGALSFCNIITKVRDPLTSMVVGRFKVMAVGIKPSGVPTRLQFVTRAPESRPAAGYTLTSRPAPDGPSRVIAITDREGRVELPPYFDENLVMLRLVAADMEPLDEFPIMPGETAEERILIIDPKREAVTLETELIALRDELIDQWSIRARLDAFIKPRIEDENWDDVRLLLEEYEKLPKKLVYSSRLELLKSEAQAQQQELKRVVLTRTAQRLLTEVDALIQRYIDDEQFASYADAYDRYAATAPPEKARKRTLPTDRPEAALAGLATPSAASAGQEEARANLVEFLPPGLGFRVAMPSTPVETSSESETFAGMITTRIFTVEDEARGQFRLTLADYPKAITTQAATRTAIDTGRIAAAAAAKGSSNPIQRDLTLDGKYPGREVELSYRPDPEGPKHMARVRTYIVGNRVYTIGIRGVEAQVRERAAEIFLDSFRLLGPPPTAQPAQARGRDATSKTEAGKSSEAPSP